MPLTSPHPRQEAKLGRRAEERRAAAFAALDADKQASAGTPDAGRLAPAHIARALGLVSALWDRVGWVPAGLARSRVRSRLRWLAEDDALLRRCGGVPALEPDEVRLACIDRGLDVLGKTDEDLRARLATWLRLAASETEKDCLTRLEYLLTRRPDDWDEARD